MGSTTKLKKGISQITLPTPFLVGPVNLYLCEYNGTLTLVDVGPKTEEAWNCFQRELKGLGYRPEDIDQIILTHHHPDHIGMLEYFTHSYHLAGHWKNDPWLTQDPQFLLDLDQFYTKLYKSLGVPERYVATIRKENQMFLKFSSKAKLDQYLKDGDGINGMFGWKVIETPGHAQSHIVLFNEETGIMLGGDHLIKDISSNAIIEGPYGNETERPQTLLQYRDSMEKCLHLPISAVYSGHGDSIDNVRVIVQQRLARQDERAEQIKGLLKETSYTCMQLCQKLFPTIYEKQLALTLSETLGHLDLLESRGEITIDDRNGQYFYKVE